MAAHQAPPSLGFSRQEHWSGLPFPSPMQESEKWKWSHWVMSNSQRPHGLQPTRLLRPWDFPGKSTGVGCHCLLHIWGFSELQLFCNSNFKDYYSHNIIIKSLIYFENSSNVTQRHEVRKYYWENNTYRFAQHTDLTDPVAISVYQNCQATKVIN